MKKWDNRPDEIKYLLNPAFCGLLIYIVMEEYIKKTKSSFPFLLSYLILPLLLPDNVRHRINRTKYFSRWVQLSSSQLISFSRMAKALVPFTNEAIEFLLQSGSINLTQNGSFNVCSKALRKSTNNSELKDFIKKARQIGRWFSETNDVASIYICLGVKP